MSKVDGSQRVEGGPTEALHRGRAAKPSLREQRDHRPFRELLGRGCAGDGAPGQRLPPAAYPQHRSGGAEPQVAEGGESQLGPTAVIGRSLPSGDEGASAIRRREHERETVADEETAVFFCDGGLLPTTLAVPVPPGAAGSVGPSGLASTASFNELVSRLVTSVAMGGDGRRGSMRLELGGRGARGSSSSSQSSLLVHAEGDEVEIEIHAPPGVDTTALERNVQARLAQKGVRVTRFDVT